MARSAAGLGLMVLLCTTILLHGHANASCTCPTTPVTKIVGGATGWALNSIQSLLGGISCLVGDKCLFNYVPSKIPGLVNNVLQVSALDYLLCNTANPINKFTTGKDLISFPKKGTYYYICGNKSYCLKGLKVAVTVN